MIGDKHSGKILDERYELVRLLDEGGMGAVYLGRHTKIGRKAAVKFLHAALAGQKDVVQRFYREAQAASAISHPNIIDIYDVGVAEWGEPYLVMEYLSGENLESFLNRKGPIGLSAACAVMEPALRALSAAHDNGIVHRDMKPENIFIVMQTDGPPLIKLIDFGISKFVQEDTLKLTRTGTLLGTPSFMSPEQARGKGEIDHRADIYSLGVILYELLTGALPFVGESYNDLIFTILTEPYRSPEVVYADFPEAARPILERLLQKEPDARYQTCGEVLAALESLDAYANRYDAFVKITNDMPEDCFATGDLGPEYATDDAVAATVLADISSNPDAETVDIPPEEAAEILAQARNSDDEWVMDSGHLPQKKRPERRRSAWPVALAVALLGGIGLLLFASGLLTRTQAGQPESDEEMQRLKAKMVGLEAESRRVDKERRQEILPPESPTAPPDEQVFEADSDKTDRDTASSTELNNDTAATAHDEATPSKMSHESGEEAAASHVVPPASGASKKPGPPKKPKSTTATPPAPEEKKTAPAPAPSLPPSSEPSEPETSPGTPIVVGGSDKALTSKDLNRLAETKDNRIQRCYEMATIGMPDLAGTIVVKLGVAGERLDVSVYRNDLPPALTACVLKALRSIKPPLNNGERIEIYKEYEFRLRSPK